MQVYCGEGVATHTSPEPCIAAREDCLEASVGKTCKPAIVPRKMELIGMPTVKTNRKATRVGPKARGSGRSRVVLEPGEHGSLLFGNRERSRLTSNAGPYREGARAEADDARS